MWRVLHGPGDVGPEVHVVGWLLLRLLGLVYLAAYASLGLQVHGLIGAEGILPVERFLDAARQGLGAKAYWMVPTLFWLDAGDLALGTVCLAGIALSVALVLGFLPRTCTRALYIGYLSLFYAGQVFMTYQWDLFLLEAGFLAIFMPGASRWVIWLFRWLLFRFMFLSGCVKWLSGDPSWRELTALSFHYETQPLPGPLAWYAHHLPDSFHRFGVAATFAIELAVPFLIFAPRRIRFIAAASFVVLQVMIGLTGNYNFFNLLTLVLCLSLLDDHALRRATPQWCAQHARAADRPLLGPGFQLGLAWAIGAVVVYVGSVQLVDTFARRAIPDVVRFPAVAIAPLRVVNRYGLFAVMTTSRPEIVIEGSDDGASWQAYEFKYKPGRLERRPSINIPHQPRLDWQMWFAALRGRPTRPWFGHFMSRLLQGSPEVVALLEDNPFPDAPPRYVRARLYDYRFADPETRRRTGQWWVREPRGMFMGAVSLQAE